MANFWAQFFGVSKPVQDVTDDELPYEARVTWDNLDEVYDFDDEED